MEGSRTRERFEEIVSAQDAEVDLATAALLIAGEEYPQLEIRGPLQALDDLGAAARDRVRGRSRLADQVEALSGLLFQEQGFRGNSDDYYDPRNSFLNDVLERRTGIPITLSLVYMEVGARAGVRVEGLGLPGHFVVRVLGGEGQEPLVVDPFFSGAVLTSADCLRRVERVLGTRSDLQVGRLPAMTRKGILTRMLHNLKAIYLQGEDWTRALRTLDLLVALNPASAGERRDRGRAWAALSCFARAAADLESYVALSPSAPDAAEVMATAQALRAQAARLN